MDEINISWISWVEQRLARSLLDDKRKLYLRLRLEQTQDENEVKTIEKEVEENQPQMGYHCWPQGQGSEMGEAIRNRVDRDNFYERRRLYNTSKSNLQG